MPMPPAAMASADDSTCSGCKALEDSFWAQFVLSEGAPVSCGSAPGAEASLEVRGCDCNGCVLCSEFIGGGWMRYRGGPSPNGQSC